MEIEWRNDERRLRLFVHSSEAREDYIYWSDEALSNNEKKYALLLRSRLEMLAIECNGFKATLSKGVFCA